MKVDNDYLWDKTGEPDPEIQQLEDILGTLRYQPRPLEIPAGLAIGRERSFFRSAAPRLAIAATLAMLLIGLGVWYARQRSQQATPAPVAKSGNPATTASPAEQPAPNPTQNPQIAMTPQQEEVPATPRRQRSPNRPRQLISQSLIARNSTRVRNEARKAKELQEAVVAKDQLLLALRVTSAKLTFAQKKTQSTNAPEPVHNQHKIG